MTTLALQPFPAVSNDNYCTKLRLSLLEKKSKRLSFMTHQKILICKFLGCCLLVINTFLTHPVVHSLQMCKVGGKRQRKGNIAHAREAKRRAMLPSVDVQQGGLSEDNRADFLRRNKPHLLNHWHVIDTDDHHLYNPT